MEEGSQESKMTRREALKAIGVGIVGTVIAAIVAVPAVRFMVGKRQNSGTHWIQAAALKDMKQDTFMQVSYQFRTKDAWKEINQKGLLYVRKNNNETLALSAVCTHLGCLVSWHDDDQKFHCPCHGAIYDAKGNVVSGPPPGPLQRLETRVVKGIVEIGVEALS